MKTAVKKSVVMFEVSDDGREHEFGGSSYIDPFIDFIGSFGFEVIRAPHSERISIDGVDFYINDKSCSYMSKSAYSRIQAVRKPANRFISITKSYHDKNCILKVHFNKEYDGVVIRKKIQDAIGEYNNIQKEIAQRQDNDKANTIAVANHYLTQSGIKNNVQCITISEGKISFWLEKSHTNIKINNAGYFEGLDIWKIEATNEDLKKQLKMMSEIPAVVENIVSSIAAVGPVSKDLQKWAVVAYSRSFDVKTMKYNKH